MEVVERPSVGDQLVGVGQDFIRFSRLALISIVGVPVNFHLHGVDMFVRRIG